MLSYADLLALEERIKTDMKRLDSELGAVRVLKERVRAEGGGAQTALDLGKTEDRVPFAESVRNALSTFGNNNEFLVANVESVLKARGATLPAKNARARIAMVLQELVKKGVVTVAKSGKGNTPYRYRVLVADGNPEKSGGNSVRPLIPPRVKRPTQPTLAV